MQSTTCLSTITIARYDVIITILTILVLFSLAMGWVCACFLVRNQAIDRMAFLKRRAIPIAALTLITFALGWVCACFRAQVSADERIAYLKDEQARLITSIRNRIYGPNYFHNKGISRDDDARLERFDPAGSKGAITMSYVGGLGGADIHLRIQTDGSLFVIDHGASRKVSTLDQDRCADFFRRVLTSGILNFSPDVVELKLDLTQPNVSGGALDAPMTEVQISVPELDIDKKLSILSPKSDLKHYPDMIEFQLIAALEDEIQSFVPKDDPFWK